MSDYCPECGYHYEPNPAVVAINELLTVLWVLGARV